MFETGTYGITGIVVESAAANTQSCMLEMPIIEL